MYYYYYLQCELCDYRKVTEFYLTVESVLTNRVSFTATLAVSSGSLRMLQKILFVQNPVTTRYVFECVLSRGRKTVLEERQSAVVHV